MHCHLAFVVLPLPEISSLLPPGLRRTVHVAESSVFGLGIAKQIHRVFLLQLVRQPGSSLGSSWGSCRSYCMVGLGEAPPISPQTLSMCHWCLTKKKNKQPYVFPQTTWCDAVPHPGVRCFLLLLLCYLGGMGTVHLSFIKF